MKIPQPLHPDVVPFAPPKSAVAELVWTDPVSGERLSITFQGSPELLARLEAEGFLPEENPEENPAETPPENPTGTPTASGTPTPAGAHEPLPQAFVRTAG